MWQRWLTASTWVSTFESGQCTPEAFAAGIVQEWVLAVMAEAFLKPARTAFEHVLADLGCPPSCIVFLDDNQFNVDAAQAMGIQAYRTISIAEVQTALQALALLGPSERCPSARQRSCTSRESHCRS